MTIAPQHRYLALAGLFCVAGALALPLDLPVARTVTPESLPSGVRRTLELSEVFGHASGVTCILVTLWLAQRPRLGIMLRMLAGSLGAGLLADVFKLLFWRTRPVAFDLNGNVVDTFQGFVPWLTGPFASVINRGQMSLPSAHAAAAFGLAFVLARQSPKARFWFFILAAMVALQRVMMGAHFLSDVLWGAVPACLMAHYCFVRPRSRRFFEGFGVDDLARWLSPPGRTAGRAKVQETHGHRETRDTHLPPHPHTAIRVKPMRPSK